MAAGQKSGAKISLEQGPYQDHGETVYQFGTLPNPAVSDSWRTRRRRRRRRRRTTRRMEDDEREGEEEKDEGKRKAGATK
jgi:hypothetical protein